MSEVDDSGTHNVVGADIGDPEHSVLSAVTGGDGFSMVRHRPATP
ncbi:hypothetical protein [Pseudactinotalea suaedae]|nr:hypothetical protein [Pseudactinotalea suaedae]